MNNTLDYNNTNSLGSGRSLMSDSPLFNLILAASLLSKLSSGKSKVKSQHGPAYIAPLPPQGPLFWYPYDTQPFYIQRPEISTGKPFTTSSEVDPGVLAAAASAVLNESVATASNLPISANQLSPELSELLNLLITKNFSIIPIEKLSENEISEPETAYGKISSSNGIGSQEHENEQTSAISNLMESDVSKDKTDFENVGSSVDLLVAESKKKANVESSNDDYSFTSPDEDDEDDDEDLVSVSHTTVRAKPIIGALKRTTQKPPSTRINSKRNGSYKVSKRTTPMTFEDEEIIDYDVATTQASRRKYTLKSQKKAKRPSTSTTVSSFDDYETSPKRRKPLRKYTTTPTYEDYKEETESVYYNFDEDIEEDSEKNQQGNKQVSLSNDNERPNLKARQDERASTTSTTMKPTNATTPTPTPTPFPTTVTANSTDSSNVTSSDYPYYGGSDNDNISFTYGPPDQQHHHDNHHDYHPSGYGYGPSNGNEHISITYPPTGSNQDNWYNQFSKGPVFKRIQDFLTPNNVFSPLYDINYSDGNL